MLCACSARPFWPYEAYVSPVLRGHGLSDVEAGARAVERPAQSRFTIDCGRRGTGTCACHLIRIVKKTAGRGWDD